MLSEAIRGMICTKPELKQTNFSEKERTKEADPPSWCFCHCCVEPSANNSGLPLDPSVTTILTFTVAHYTTTTELLKDKDHNESHLPSKRSSLAFGVVHEELKEPESLESSKVALAVKSSLSVDIGVLSSSVELVVTPAAKSADDTPKEYTPTLLRNSKSETRLDKHFGSKDKLNIHNSRESISRHSIESNKEPGLLKQLHGSHSHNELHLLSEIHTDRSDATDTTTSSKKHRFNFKLFSFGNHHSNAESNQGSRATSPKLNRSASHKDNKDNQSKPGSKEGSPKLGRAKSHKDGLSGSEGDSNDSLNHHSEIKKIFSKQLVSQFFHLNGHNEDDTHSQASSRKQSSTELHSSDDQKSDGESTHTGGAEIKKSRSILGPIKELISSPKTKRKHDKSSDKKGYDSAGEMSSSSTPAFTPFEPATMDQYHICGNKIIGRGASGVVRLAKKGGNDKVYAIKEFRKKKKEETYREYIKKLTSEFCIGSMLHHSNVVETLDIIRDGSHWYEVMEYCQGGDLYSIIRGGQMTKVEIDCCFKQLIQGVYYLHSVGVAHRDLKPENLLIDKSGRLKITDFGVSDVFRVCWEKKPHLSKGVCGSTPYIAPEEFIEGEYDARQVDVWACGIIYYALVFRGIPWQVATTKDANYSYFLEHRGVEYEPLCRLQPGVKELMFKILEPDPKKRITVQEIMDDGWFKKVETCHDAKPPSVEHSHFVDNYELNT
jgi:hypothetical protein